MKPLFFSVLFLSGSLLVPSAHASASDSSGNTPLYVDQHIPGSSNVTKEEKLQLVEQMIARHEGSLTKARQQLAEDQAQFEALTQKSNVFSRNIPGTTKWLLGQYPEMIQNDNEHINFLEQTIKKLQEDKKNLENQK
jgi:hypothetical protein